MTNRPRSLDLSAIDKMGLAMPKSNLSPAHFNPMNSGINRIVNRRRHKSESEKMPLQSSISLQLPPANTRQRSYSFSSK